MASHSSSSVGPREASSSTLPRTSRNLVVDITDSPGPIHIQDSPLVETQDLQVMSPRGGNSQTSNPSSSSADQSHAQVARQSSEAQVSARSVVVPTFVRHFPNGTSQTVQNVADISVPDSQSEATAQAVGGLTANFREVTQITTVREGSIGAQAAIDRSDRNVRRRYRSSSQINSRSASPMMRGQNSENPTRTTLRMELENRDVLINQLRAQLEFQTQTNQTTLQNQQSHFALVGQRYEDELRASQDAQIRRSALNDHLEAEMRSRTQTLVRQEEDSQQQALLFQQIT